jgi:DNA repair protein RecN (Recombination protein N)
LADAATAGLAAAGADVVQFYLSANPGEEPKPLARIASGGELSRIMLALKALTAGAGEVATLIFDEVDAGIGGAVAEAVGKRLHAIGRERQVLCITHLPQIAAQADHHFAVEKRVTKGRTATTARALTADDRVRELTRMLGGSTSTESERYARRLIEGNNGSDSG